MPIIKLKRGNKASLTTLSAGEAAFTIDTKELFVGDGNTNYSMSSTNKNLLTNSNFQLPLAALDTDSSSAFPILPNFGRYIYGNFFLSNGPTAMGNVTATGGIPSLNGRINIAATNGLPILEYRLKLPRYMNNFKNYIYPSPLENRTLTLSFDVSNQLGKELRILTGQPSALKLVQIPIGITRISTSFTFAKTTLQSNIQCMDVVIAKFSDYLNGGIEIGNIKLEDGNKQTPYYINPIDEDAANIAVTYKVLNIVLKPYTITSNTIEFYIFNDIYTTYDYGGVYNILSAALLSSQTAQPNFSYSVSSDPNYGCIKIIATKKAHGLSDASLALKIELDYRPY